MMGSRSMAMPVTYDAQDANPRWEQLDHEAVKDLIKAIRDSGLGSPYFKQLLKGTFNIYDLTPFDLKSLASMILTNSQFIIWEAKWRRALNDLRDKYQGGANAGFTVAQLAGDPPLDNPARQARLFPREVLTDIKNAAQKAMVQIPPTGVTENIYTDINQGPSESFTSFIDRLTQAVDRQISDDGVKPHLLRCLAFVNANPECKRIISAMPGQPSMAEVIEGCSKVGTPQHIAVVLGDQVEKVIKDAFANFQQRQCYKCGKQGHFKKDCPELAEIASSLDVCPSERVSALKQAQEIPLLPSEPLVAFVERLTPAIELQVKKEEGAQEQVLEEMALTNVNEQCKAAILSLPMELAPTLDDMLQQKSPDVIVKDPVTRETKSPHDLVTWGRGYAYVSTPPGLKWVPAEWVKPFIPKSAKPPAEAPQVASAAWRRRKCQTLS
ncbi:hypothetical protein DUI87_01155 [Hirundo rustica rustica]|uniref:CCHC-type domain-containing protein n=1 Tax=Hirundo rustica rustica TaxID=333673 RepID=A0A3M0L4J2_HIRRU|nr:hypothetical protein DUI87_01155 [Hirundo rustica rustica]